MYKFKQSFLYCGIMVKALDCGILVSEFEFQSCSYVHFRTNSQGKGMNHLILPVMRLNSITSVFPYGWFWC